MLEKKRYETFYVIALVSEYILYGLCYPMSGYNYNFIDKAVLLFLIIKFIFLCILILDTNIMPLVFTTLTGEVHLSISDNRGSTWSRSQEEQQYSSFQSGIYNSVVMIRLYGKYK